MLFFVFLLAGLALVFAYANSRRILPLEDENDRLSKQVAALRKTLAEQRTRRSKPQRSGGERPRPVETPPDGASGDSETRRGGRSSHPADSTAEDVPISTNSAAAINAVAGIRLGSVDRRQTLLLDCR
jgi:hypothetical protein